MSCFWGHKFSKLSEPVNSYSAEVRQYKCCEVCGIIKSKKVTHLEIYHNMEGMKEVYRKVMK